MKIRKDLRNQRFGKLLVIDLDPIRDKAGLTRWKCICDCGNECVVRIDCLTRETTKSCGCLLKLPLEEDSFNSLLLNYNIQAKKRNLVFELSKEDFRKLTKQNCYYCGIEPLQEISNKNQNSIYIYNGIDRLNNNLGYIKDNVVSCCGSCNRAKDTLNFEQFKKIIKRTYINLYKKVSDKTPGELIDALITVDIKCFMYQDKLMDNNLSDSERLKVAEITMELNKKRNHLMRSIDMFLDFQEDMVTPKTYLSNVDSNSDPEF